jgi:NDP-hexose-3-ketoreductase
MSRRASNRRTFGLDNAYTSTYALWGSEGRIVVDRAFTPPADHRPVVRVERSSGAEDVILEPDDQVANTVAAFAGADLQGGVVAVNDCLRQAELMDEVRRRAGVTMLAGDHGTVPGRRSCDAVPGTNRADRTGRPRRHGGA